MCFLLTESDPCKPIVVKATFARLELTFPVRHKNVTVLAYDVVYHRSKVKIDRQGSQACRELAAMAGASRLPSAFGYLGADLRGAPKATKWGPKE